MHTSKNQYVNHINYLARLSSLLDFKDIILRNLIE